MKLNWERGADDEWVCVLDGYALVFSTLFRSVKMYKYDGQYLTGFGLNIGRQIANLEEADLAFKQFAEAMAKGVELGDKNR